MTPKQFVPDPGLQVENDRAAHFLHAGLFGISLHDVQILRTAVPRPESRQQARQIRPRQAENGPAHAYPLPMTTYRSARPQFRVSVGVESHLRRKFGRSVATSSRCALQPRNRHWPGALCVQNCGLRCWSVMKSVDRASTPSHS